MDRWCVRARTLLLLNVIGIGGSDGLGRMIARAAGDIDWIGQAVRPAMRPTVAKSLKVCELIMNSVRPNELRSFGRTLAFCQEELLRLAFRWRLASLWIGLSSLGSHRQRLLVGMLG